MRRTAIALLAVLFFSAQAGGAQGKLSTRWEELSAAEFRQAIGQAKGTCMLPFGILEKQAHIYL